jgi:hypothetical protein
MGPSGDARQGLAEMHGRAVCLRDKVESARQYRCRRTRNSHVFIVDILGRGVGCLGKSGGCLRNLSET